MEYVYSIASEVEYSVLFSFFNFLYYASFTYQLTLEESKQADRTTGQATHRVSRGIHHQVPISQSFLLLFGEKYNWVRKSFYIFRALCNNIFLGLRLMQRDHLIPWISNSFYPNRFQQFDKKFPPFGVFLRGVLVVSSPPHFCLPSCILPVQQTGMLESLQ